MKKSILALVLAAVLITALVFVAAPKAEAAGNHNCTGNHCVCAGKSTAHCDCKKVKWTAVGTADEFTAAFGNGAYVYLTADITIAEEIKCYNVKSICLNGYTLTCKGKNGVIVGTTSASENDRVLTITDCQYTGTKGGTLDSRIAMRSNSVLKIYGGFLTNTNTGAVEVINQSSTYIPNAVNLYRGHIKGGEGVRAVFQGAGCTVNMYGGTISGGSGSTEDGKYYGGNIVASGTFNISGGTITGGKADVGGNIYVKTGGTLNISGKAVIENGTANNSGNIFAEGDVYMKGGTVKNGVSLTNYGGNIQMSGKKDALAILKISGGTVSGGTTVKYNGGNIALQNADCTISGGTISGGEVTGADSASKGGGNIALVSGKLTISGGKITGGKALNGGNILIRQNDNTKQADSQLVITGGTITGGTATSNGGNIYIFNDSETKSPSKLEISGGIISNGSAGTADNPGNGGNLYSNGSDFALRNGINITGGTFIGGTATRYGGSICFNSKLGSNIVIKNATFTGGKVLNNFGGNLYFNTTNVSVLIENCTVSGGAAIEAGGNIYNNGAVEFVVKDCTITKGSAKIGGGISVKPGLLVKLQGEVNAFDNVNGGLGVRFDTEAGTRSMFGIAGLTGGKVSIFAQQAGLVCEETSNYVVAAKDTQELKEEGGKLYLQGKGGNVISVNGTGYATIAEAVAAMADGDKLQLFIGLAGQKLELSKDAIVDLNGCAIDEITVAAGKTLYGCDSSTNGYTSGGATKVKITGEGTVAATCQTTEPIRKYITVKDGETYSFHRFYVGITKKTLHVGTKGIGVTAVFAGTPEVKALLKDAKTFGVEINNAEDFTGTATNVAASAGFVSSEVNTLQAVVDDYLLTKDSAEAKLYARAYLELADGTKLYSAVATVDAKEVMQAIDVSAAAMDQGKKKAVQAMINGLGWNMPKEWGFTNFAKK